MAIVRSVSAVAALAALLAVLLFAPVPAFANHTIHPFETGCLLTSGEQLSLEEAEARSTEFDCSPEPSAIDTSHAWLRLTADRTPFPEGPLHIESDIAPVDALTIAIRYADGGEEVYRYDEADIAHHWTAGPRYSLYLSDGERPIEEVLIGAEGLWSRASVTTFEILPQHSAMEQRFGRAIVFSIYCGLVLLPILYSGAFFFFLRYRFMLLHALMAIGIVTFTFASSNLFLYFVPQDALWPRMMLSYASLSVAIGIAGFFSLSFIEEGILKPWHRKLVAATSVLLLANAVCVVTIWPELPFIARNLYHLAYLPQLIAFAILLPYAVLKGSRAAWFILAGWSVTALIAADRILRGLDMYILPDEVDYSLYLGLTIEAIVTAFGVAYRVLVLRRERDQAVAREQELQRLADTDGLTGLGNRRSFDLALTRNPTGALAILDLDHFKQINDRYGHQVGDDVLREAGKLLRGVRSKGYCRIAYRLGGEEFALLLDARNPDEARILADAIRMTFIVTIEQAVRVLNEPITVSIGVAMIDGRPADEIFATADAALYEAKQAGRDRVMLEEGAIETPEGKRSGFSPKPRAA
jgi:diguanylate cyclase (GGDEF)-like protein